MTFTQTCSQPGGQARIKIIES